MLISIQFGWFPRFHFSGPHLLKWFSEERRMRREMEEHNDLVFLPVTEGYRMNSRKVRDCDGCDGCWHWYDLVWISWQLRMAGVSGWSYCHSHSPSLDAWLPLCWRSDFLVGKLGKPRDPIFGVAFWAIVIQIPPRSGIGFGIPRKHGKSVLWDDWISVQVLDIAAN